MSRQQLDNVDDFFDNGFEPSKKKTKKNRVKNKPDVSTVIQRDLILTQVKPLTENQKTTFEKWNEGKNLVLYGTAGTGKTYLALYLAIKDLLKTKFKKILVIRSAVPTRDIGFLPGNLKFKAEVYESPYASIVNSLFSRDDAYSIMKHKGGLEFITTSFIRGITIEDTCIIVDEIANMSFHELDSIITRMGENSRIIFSGDYAQTDLRNRNERTQLFDFLNITDQMESFARINFTIEDIVRSGLVKEYMVTKERVFARR